ncbi:MAG: alpha/beta fold hydrolase [Pseudomonadota bacterium]
MKSITLLTILIACFFGMSSKARDRGPQETDPYDPSGYWSGAVIQRGSVLRVNVAIVKNEGGFAAEVYFPDWIFYAPMDKNAVAVAGDTLVIDDFLGGDAQLTIDAKSSQMFGSVGGGNNAQRLHLKRMPSPPISSVYTRPTTFRSADGTKLSGTLTFPTGSKRLGGIVMVRGRGCAARVNGKARFFARYGVGVLTFDKRGAGQSEGDCKTFTFHDLTSDAVAALSHLAAHPQIDRDRVGFLGESAGAWTIQAATERQRLSDVAVKPAFLITWIGPATSILQQQISSAGPYGEAIGLTKAQQKLLVDATMIIANSKLSDDEAFMRLDAIRRAAQAQGWLERGFGEDDIPATRADMERLWLRRFRYDPGPFLSTLGDLPYLAIFGGDDPIVPVAENIAALEGRGPNVDISIVREGGHGYGYEEQSRTLPNGKEVWIFEGSQTQYAAETIRFLREIKILAR